MNKKPIIRLSIAGLIVASVLGGGIAYVSTFQGAPTAKTSSSAETVKPTETPTATPTPDPAVEPTEAPVVEPAPEVQPVAPAPVAAPQAPAPVAAAPQAPAPVAAAPAPVRCPAGSTANSSDGFNDTSCYPDICFTIAVPDPAHPECDVAFKP